MSLVGATAAVLGLLLLASLWSRRPFRVGVAGGLFLGPLAYYLVGGHLARARGEGRFYSFPFGGYGVRDAELFASVGLWIVACGLAAALLARLVLRRRAA